MQSLFGVLVGSEEITHLATNTTAMLQSAWSDNKNGPRQRPASVSVIALRKVRCTIH
jgi:hypothetical protein